MNAGASLHAEVTSCAAKLDRRRDGVHKQAGVAETIVLATDLISLDDVTSSEMVLHLIGPDQAGTAVPGERAVFEVEATINGQADTFAEVRIGTGDADDALLSVTHQPLADLLDQSG